ncbi:MAG TPA: hypothetical protein PKH27_04805 [Candidatus Desulfobacillus denitrificans]|nr:hypothetical protein [Candidatus Desulfobacillus denitrificans]HNT62368.1 hypothetical protein [Candidatus Desulfobacillus denitrificans]
MSESKTLDRRIAEAQHHLRTLQGEIAEACNRTTDPDDPTLVELDKQIEATQATIRRLETIQTNQKNVISAEERARQKKARADAYRRAVTLAKSRIELAGKLEAEISKVGVLLKEWAAIGEQCRDAVGQVHRVSDSFDYHLFDLAYGRNGSMVVALDTVIGRAGIGRVGIPLPGMSDVPRSMQSTLVETATVCVAKIEGLMQGHLASYGEQA